MKSKYLLAGVGIGAGVLLLTGFGGKSVPGQQPDYPGKPKVGPGDSWTWGSVPVDDPTLGFDFAGNGIFFGQGTSAAYSAGCDWVIEGNLFWPKPNTTGDFIEAPTVAEALAIPGNTIGGWLDYMILTAGVTDPIAIAQQFITETAPFCWDVVDQWPESMLNWYENFVSRVTDYVEAWEGSIDFGGRRARR
jgi:hypothetical protein